MCVHVRACRLKNFGESAKVKNQKSKAGNIDLSMKEVRSIASGEGGGVNH